MEPLGKPGGSSFFVRHLGMFRITFALEGLQDKTLAAAEMAVLLDALVRVDMTWLDAHREMGPLARYLQTGVLQYVDEPQGVKPAGREDWQDIPTCLHVRRDGLRTAGNRDLVCWRVAELRLQGIEASVALQTSGSKGFRAAVLMPDGSTEDVVAGRGWRKAEPHQRITFVVELFKGKEDRAISNAALTILLNALTDIDEMYLRKHPEMPNLYDTDVRYVEEPPGQEDWQDVGTCLRIGRADCDDLACWRAAEIRVRHGARAFPVYKAQERKDGSMLYHILTSWPDGKIEDPSAIRGMR
jgi:hypothetical protein